MSETAAPEEIKQLECPVCGSTCMAIAAVLVPSAGIKVDWKSPDSDSWGVAGPSCPEHDTHSAGLDGDSREVQVEWNCHNNHWWTQVLFQHFHGQELGNMGYEVLCKEKGDIS
jgi:hypothetical protein